MDQVTQAETMTMNIRVIDVSLDERVETGPVQFRDDWPGIFIRGDEASHLALVLNRVLREYSIDQPARSDLEMLCKYLMAQ